MLWKAAEIVPLATKTVEVCANFADPSAQKCLTEETSVNAKVSKSGALFCAPARKRLFNATTFGAVDVFPVGSLVCCTNEQTIYKPRSGSSVSYDHVFTSPVFLNCLKNGTLLVSQSGDQTAILKDGVWSKAADFGFDSLALFCERVFGADGGNEVKFSARDDFSNFDGSIVFPCRIFALTVCRDELFAVGDDIFRIDFDDETPKTKVVAVCSNVGTIFGKTVKSVADTIFFLSSEGLFRYKSGQIKQILLNVETDESNYSATAAVTADRYWVSFAPKGETSPQLVAEIDASTFAPVCCHSVSTDYLSGGDRLIFNVDSRPHTFVVGYENFVWKSRPCDCGVVGEKHFRNIFVKTSADLTVKISTEKETRTFDFEGSAEMQFAKIRGAFLSFTAELSSVDGATVEQFGIVAVVR